MHCANESFMVFGELRLLPEPLLCVLRRKRLEHAAHHSSIQRVVNRLVCGSLGSKCVIRSPLHQHATTRPAMRG